MANSEIVVLDAAFAQSIERFSQAPSVLYSEIAVLGRSNVGKSTLINLLLNRKNLAKSSATPGKTRLINFFLTSWRKNGVKYDLRFVDFPGFGYARVSKAQKNAWDRDLSEFLKKRDSIKIFLHLVDSRHRDLPQDSEIGAFLGKIMRGDCEILRVFTKCDKLNRNDFRALAKVAPCVSRDSAESVSALRNLILARLFGV